MGIKVLFGTKISAELQYLPEKDLVKILQFKQHVEIYGLENLAGRNKSSDDVPTNDPYWAEKVAKAQKYSLRWLKHKNILYGIIISAFQNMIPVKDLVIILLSIFYIM
ncbi:hypothetical protein [Mannheimia haemolytica]|uniref:hypothetical protein n=1 Tax=Mannheimia haemolytica TaxID=75985 RepID=UPI001EE2FFD3|nr:hypothetical protein [Mannheimia haemolytica]